MSEKSKAILQTIVWFLVTTIWILIGIELDMGGFIRYHLHKEKYTVQEVELIKTQRTSSVNYWGDFVYVVDGMEKEGTIPLNIWERKGEKVKIVVDEEGEYDRRDIIISFESIESMFILIINIGLLYVIIVALIKKIFKIT